MNEGPNNNWLILVKSWVLEKLEDERRFNRRENDLLKSEVHESIHQAHFSRWSVLERGWSTLNERGVNDLQGRVRDLEMELIKLRRENRGLVEMERMAQRVSSMEQQMAKMQQECVKERKEMAERESERNIWMEKEIERVRKKIEEELAKERTEMAIMEKERKREVERCILQLKEERTRQKKEMESEIEALRAQTKKTELRQTAMERVVEGIEVWVMKREAALLQRVEAAIDKLEDRMDQMEILTSSRQDILKMELEALTNAMVAGLEKRFGDKILEIADYMAKAYTKTTNHCLLKGVRTLVRPNDQSDTILEDPMVARHSDYQASVRGDKGGKRRGRRRRAKEKRILSSTESGSESGNGSGSGNGNRSRVTRTWRKPESERKSLRRPAVEVDSDTDSSAVCSEPHRETSGIDPSKTGSVLSVNAKAGDNNKRGFLRKLFGKKKRKKV